jgi:hypothetical protein
VGPRAGVDVVENRKILHCRESNPGCPALSPRCDWTKLIVVEEFTIKCRYSKAAEISGLSILIKIIYGYSEIRARIPGELYGYVV